MSYSVNSRLYVVSVKTVELMDEAINTVFMSCPLVEGEFAQKVDTSTLTTDEMEDILTS